MRQPISIIDRIVSVITYMTMGWGGVIYTIILYYKRKQLSWFARYNIFQSIFLSLLLFCIHHVSMILFKLLSLIPLINYLVAQISFFFNRPFIGEYSFIQTVVFGIIIYSVIMSAAGKYPRIYWVSRVIERTFTR